MKILYVGDIMGKAGREVVKNVLPALKLEQKIDFVIAQAENSNDEGKGPRRTDIEELQAAGVDFFTGGNHSFSNSETDELYTDPSVNLLRPLNVENKQGKGYGVVAAASKRILVISLLGQTVGSQKLDTTNPLQAVDTVLESQAGEYDLAIVNFHGDFSSEKVVIGYYLDGKVAAVIGDHWHVPTADAMLLPKGTAHITDIGMCGTLDSSLGVKLEIIIDRWLRGTPRRNELETAGRMQFNAVLVTVNDSNNKPQAIELISRIF